MQKSPEARIPIKQFAKGMRLEPTRAEEKMYNALLQAFAGYRASVHAQEPIGPYIADFYIAPANIVVEVDGPIHDTKKAKDRKRDKYMQSKGIRVMRFTNRQVDRNPNACALYVFKQCGEMPKQTANGRRPAITYCPPGSGIQRQTRAQKQLFWRA